MFLEQQIRTISERSCDTEDWSNDAENSALITARNRILKYIDIENSYFKLKSYKRSLGEHNEILFF